MRRLGILSAAAAMMAMSAVSDAEFDDRPSRRRERSLSPAPSSPRDAYRGDGFDAERIAAAERKRARKAAKQRPPEPPQKDNGQ